MKTFQKKIWFLTGSQHLYGKETLDQVAVDAKKIADYLDKSPMIPCNVEYAGVVTTADEIYDIFSKANQDKDCIGIITWMHTFSPGKMWINAFNILAKPLLHFHTQFNRDIPWDTIDMDFMNLNQAAHGDREHGFICSRMGISRKVVIGYWQDECALNKIAVWCRAAAAWDKSKSLKVARFGDNMRDVAVTEGDKVEAQVKLGWSINGYGVGDLVKLLNEVSETEVSAKVAEYTEKYDINTDNLEAVKHQAKIEVAMRKFLESGNFSAFTTTFEDLHGLEQLPGLAIQNLMNDGYGFGGEGDWKTAALTHIMKYMSTDMEGGNSFMEDYTYNFEPGKEMILGAHMLEVCPTISKEKPRVEVHPLGIGGKADPARLVFDGVSGDAIVATLLDMGNRFRMLVNVIDLVDIEREMPKLPVARVLWKPQPDLFGSAEAWILAGGAHHTCLSTGLTVDYLRDFCEMADIELVIIDKNTDLNEYKNSLKVNGLYWSLKGLVK